MSAERSGPAICNVSNIGEAKDEMTKASIDLQDLRRRLYVKRRLNRAGGSEDLLRNERASAGNDGIGGGCTTLEGCLTPIECDATGRKSPQQDRPHKRWREANGGAQCGKSARCVRRGGDWKRGMVEIVGHSQTKGRDNREPKLRPKPARQSSTLLIGGIEETSASCEARYAPRSYPTGLPRALWSATGNSNRAASAPGEFSTANVSRGCKYSSASSKHSASSIF